MRAHPAAECGFPAVSRGMRRPPTPDLDPDRDPNRDLDPDRDTEAPPPRFAV